MLPASLLCCVASIAVWSLAAGRLDAWRVSPALVLALLGATVGLLVRPEIVLVLDYPVTEQVVELVLATLLFSDALAVRGRMLGSSPAVSSRLLFVALPVSLALAAALGVLLLPGLPVSLVLVIACIFVPTDISPAPAILSDRRIPHRVRSALNVESGLNDGIVAPVFAFALAAVTASAVGSEPDPDAGSSALAGALEASGIALAVGLGTGFAYGSLVRIARARSWSEDAAIRIGMLAVPLTTYCIAVLLDGNGFVAAFVSGVAVHLCLRSETEQFTGFTKEVVETTSLALWFVFGVLAGVVFLGGVHWQVVVIAILALTVLRAVPVGLALIRSRTAGAERIALALLGPRGVTSLVFGLLAVNAIDDDNTILVLQIMVLTVSGSLLLHGLGAATLARRIFPSEPSPQHEAAAHPEEATGSRSGVHGPAVRPAARGSADHGAPAPPAADLLPPPATAAAADRAPAGLNGGQRAAVDRPATSFPAAEKPATFPTQAEPGTR